MTRSELKTIKVMLEAKRTELQQLIRKREGIVIEKSADTLDEMRHAAERELALRMLDRDSSLIRYVRAALRRIEENTFGVCLHCENDISPKRLFAVPWSPFCIECQEMADGNREGGREERFVEQWIDAA